MTLALILTAIRRHPFSMFVAALLVIVFASLSGIAVPLALAGWGIAGLAYLELWYIFEPFVLRRLGCFRAPSHDERERLGSTLNGTRLEPLIAETRDLVAVRSIRCLMIGRDLLDLLEDRALSGALHQATVAIHSADTTGTLLVWLGSLPLLAGVCVNRLLGLLGRLLGVAVGTSLVVPLVLWPQGFVLWSGRIFGSAIVGLFGSMLVSSGLAAAGLALLLAWPAVAGIRVLLAWESRRAQRCADQAVVDAGFGPQLVEALELLAEAEQQNKPGGVLGWFCRQGDPPIERALRIRGVLERLAPRD